MFKQGNRFNWCPASGPIIASPVNCKYILPFSASSSGLFNTIWSVGANVIAFPSGPTLTYTLAAYVIGDQVTDTGRSPNSSFATSRNAIAESGYAIASPSISNPITRSSFGTSLSASSASKYETSSQALNRTPPWIERIFSGYGCDLPGNCKVTRFAKYPDRNAKYIANAANQADHKIPHNIP